MNDPLPPIQPVLDAVLRGNVDAFHAILRQYGPPLRAYLATQVFQLDDVDDLAQETFVTAYRNLRNFELDKDFGAWLRGIARNKLRHYFDAAARRDQLMVRFRLDAAKLLEQEFEANAAESREHDLQLMLGCIAKLPPKLRKVVHSWLDGGKSVALAEELETSVAAVYQLQYRAVKLLRECVHRKLAHGS
jgi:RNA polymerase sigma-70 factor (ECF subfamily)